LHLPLVVPPSGVLANDGDPESSPLTAIPGSGPSHGSLALNANGGFTYTPASGYSGPDSFTYQASDGLLSSNVATVTLTVVPPVSGGLVNGGFESDYSGWTWSGNQQIRPNSSLYVASEGVKHVGFNGGNSTPDGVLSQTFATTPSQAYRLEFDAGVLAFNFNTQSLRVSATGSSSLLSQVVTVTGGGGGGTRWFPLSFTFVADSNSTTLTFRDQSGSTNSLDLLLDNVRVTAISTIAAIAPTPPVDLREPSASSALLSVTPDPGFLGIASLSGRPGDITVSMIAVQAGIYVLECSEDLVHWEKGGETETAEPGLVEFHDQTGPLELPKPQRFYRIFKSRSNEE
jgi:hypothetical protein